MFVRILLFKEYKLGTLLSNTSLTKPNLPKLLEQFALSKSVWMPKEHTENHLLLKFEE